MPQSTQQCYLLPLLHSNRCCLVTYHLLLCFSLFCLLAFYGVVPGIELRALPTLCRCFIIEPTLSSLFR